MTLQGNINFTEQMENAKGDAMPVAPLRDGYTVRCLFPQDVTLDYG